VKFPRHLGEPVYLILILIYAPILTRQALALPGQLVGQQLLYSPLGGTCGQQFRTSLLAYGVNQTPSPTLTDKNFRYQAVQRRLQMIHPHATKRLFNILPLPFLPQR